MGMWGGVLRLGGPQTADRAAPGRLFTEQSLPMGFGVHLVEAQPGDRCFLQIFPALRLL